MISVCLGVGAAQISILSAKTHKDYMDELWISDVMFNIGYGIKFLNMIAFLESGGGCSAKIYAQISLLIL